MTNILIFTPHTSMDNSNLDLQWWRGITVELRREVQMSVDIQNVGYYLLIRAVVRRPSNNRGIREVTVVEGFLSKIIKYFLFSETLILVHSISFIKISLQGPFLKTILALK